jgi:hypothetical protein
VQALPRVSEALGRRVGWLSVRGLSVLSGESAKADPCPAAHSSRAAIKPAVVVKDLRTTSHSPASDDSSAGVSVVRQVQDRLALAAR